jgi:uncharacterized membrane protein YgcG
MSSTLTTNEFNSGLQTFMDALYETIKSNAAQSEETAVKKKKKSVQFVKKHEEKALANVSTNAITRSIIGKQQAYLANQLNKEEVDSKK